MNSRVDRETSVAKLPKAETRRIVIIGAGPGGICMAIKLLEAGVDDFVILEKADGVGGTWWHNRYPGAACDVPAILYSYSFEPKPDWYRPYANQPQLQQYFAECALKYGVMPHVQLGTEVVRAEWIETDSRWRVDTAAGDRYVAQCVVSAQGMFNELSWPDIAGLDDFAGTLFHSGRWETDHDLRAERVGVIGSAASAVQFVPAIAPEVDKLTLFQRTANWVLPKADDPYDPETIELYRRNPEALRAVRERFWQDLEGFVLFDDPRRQAKSEEMGHRNLSVVSDPQLRATLTPTHPFGCKRPLISNDYYPTFNRDNVEVITASIERITPEGVRTTDGQHHRFDTIVIATGFNVTRFLSAIEVVGRDGLNLSKAWSDGAQAYLGMTVAGFPNLFQLYGPNTNQGTILYMIERQVEYIVGQINRLGTEGLAWLEVKRTVMDAYNEAIQADAENIGVWSLDCGNYYRHPSGRLVTQYPHNMAHYRDATAQPDLDAFEFG